MATKREHIFGTNYWDVVVEKQDTNMAFGENVPILLDFDQKKEIGSATLYNTAEGIVANMNILKVYSVDSLYPAIGFKVEKQQYKAGDIREIMEGKIFSVGLSATRNADITILPLGQQLV